MRQDFIISLLVALLLAACSGAPAGGTGAQANGKLQPMTALVIGTLRLDGTANAVTKDQAAELLPLWEVYRDLIASDTAAQQEIDGLTEQIRQAMTAEQQESIGSMKLTQQDVLSVVEEQGSPTAGGPSQQSRRQNSGGGGMPGGGGPPGGGFPGGGMSSDGGGPMGGGNPMVASTQTASGTPGVFQRATANRVPVPLLEALIQYLQKKAAS